MVRIRIIGMALVTVFAIFAVVAASASALEWLLNGAPIATATAVSSSGSLLLEDLAATGGAVAIECTGTDEGTVGPGAKDEVKKITATSCKFQTGKNGICEASEPVKANAINIAKGWQTLLVTNSKGQIRDLLSSAEVKGPGWNVECKVDKILEVSDECTSASPSPLATNVTGGVDVTFEASETASCSKGNSTSGMVIGTDLNANPAKDTLTVSASSAK
jgi:hypothetical protein